MARDMTEKQFKAALESRGMSYAPMGGIQLSCGVLCMFIRNQGANRRAILAYCIQQDDRHKREDRERRRKSWGEAVALTSGVV